MQKVRKASLDWIFVHSAHSFSSCSMELMDWTGRAEELAKPVRSASKGKDGKEEVGCGNVAVCWW